MGGLLDLLAKADACATKRCATEELAAKDARIRELEDDLAKRKELPPLPMVIRRHVAELRGMVQSSLFDRDRELLAWFDTLYPKPVPQWERDAQYLERSLGSETRSAYSPDEIKAIAARIREANREAK